MKTEAEELAALLEGCARELRATQERLAAYRDAAALKPVVAVPELLTYKEAAKYLSVSVSYVETLVRQRKLPAVRLPATDSAGRVRDGRLVRIRIEDLRAFAATHRT